MRKIDNVETQVEASALESERVREMEAMALHRETDLIQKRWWPSDSHRASLSGRNPIPDGMSVWFITMHGAAWTKRFSLCIIAFNVCGPITGIT